VLVACILARRFYRIASMASDDVMVRRLLFAMGEVLQS
jgi:hypothetical protein